MFNQITRGRHGAPKARRTRAVPDCGLIPAPDVPVVPSMDLPEGHMRTRPHQQVVLGAGRRYRDDDVVEITDYATVPAHVGCIGTVLEISGTFRPLVVRLPGGRVIFCAESEVKLVQPAPMDANTLVMEAIAAGDVEGYAARCEAQGEPLANWERELLAEPVVEAGVQPWECFDADDAEPAVAVWHVPGAAIGAYTVTDSLALDAELDELPLMGGASR